ncbi:MAG: methylmalonyl Co-A mutase-associated GTPase MeaB, partial [Syntrophales bacterium LBB04]|nr:methylmalonyl Co-A mutase-associated GTPase MeaB [Syntrophales bacterium LBB04]
GCMESADIFVNNKPAREGSLKLRRELGMLLDMAPPETFKAGWRPPIIEAGNVIDTEPFGRAMDELTTTIEGHYRYLVDHDLLGSRIRRKMTVELNEAIRTCVLEPVLSRLAANGEIEGMLDQMLKKEADPYTLAEKVAKKYLKET